MHAQTDTHVHIRAHTHYIHGHSRAHTLHTHSRAHTLHTYSRTLTHTTYTFTRTRTQAHIQGHSCTHTHNPLDHTVDDNSWSSAPTSSFVSFDFVHRWSSSSHLFRPPFSNPLAAVVGRRSRPVDQGSLFGMSQPQSNPATTTVTGSC